MDQTNNLPARYLKEVANETGADLGFIKGGGGLTQGTNLLGRGV